MELNIDLLTPQVVAENTHTPLQVMPDALYQQLLTELRTDPELDSILNNMTDPKAGDLVEDTEQDAMLNDLVEDAEQDAMLNDLEEQTPIEKELQYMGY